MAAKNRFSSAIGSGQIQLPVGNAIVLNAQSENSYDLFESVSCFQSFKPIYDQLVAQGISLEINFQNKAQVALVELTRSKTESQGLIAKAFNGLEEGGLLIVNGDKTYGIESHLSSLKKLVTIDGVFSKAHGKLFWFTKANKPDLFEKWISQLEPSQSVGGYHTAAGVFSENSIDKGSALLIDRISGKIKGRGADLGAGWGYLSSQVLSKFPDITSLDVVEADANALKCAKMNLLQHDKLQFFWEDALNFSGANYDFVVMNPPFHQTRKAEPSLGQKFIQKAASVLAPKGILWMVANRQLAYETTLEASFLKWECVLETPQFKVISAARPKVLGKSRTLR